MNFDHRWLLLYGRAFLSCREFRLSMATPLRPLVLGLSTFSAETSKSSTLLCSYHRPYNISPLKEEGFLRGRNLKFSEGLRSIRPSGRKEGIAVEAVVKRSPKRLKYSSPPFRKGDGVLYVEVDPSGVDAWRLEPVIELLKNGAVGIIPTDTVYAFVSDVKNPMAVERIHRIKGMDTKKPLSILCHSFRDIDTYTTGLPCGNSQGHANIFRAARQCLPGPYTFVLPASKELPKQCVKSGTSRAKHVSRKCVGVRMPNDAICQAILEKLDGPLLCSSVRTADDEWIIDPVVIADIYAASMGQEGVDFIVDGGVRVADPSTVVDMTGSEPILLRKGKGVCYDWMLPKESEETLI